MFRRLLWIAALLIAVFSARAETYSYSRQQGGNVAVYEARGYVIIATLPEINWDESWNKLRNVDISIPEEKLTWRGLKDFSNEYGEFYYGYITNGHYVIRAGKIVRNQVDAPAVDVASFRAFGRFAADKDSLYFDGVRTDDNVGKKRVNMENLKAVANNTTMLTDGRSLYVKGRWQGSAHGFTALAQKSWRQRGFFYDLSASQGTFDVIARTNTGIFINGESIDAEPDSFEIIRWMPNELLVYRDKNGVKRFPFGKGKESIVLAEQKPIDCSKPFDIRVDKVTWRKQRATARGDDCVVETLSNVDPERFRLITDRIAQYQDRLYAVMRTKFGEEQMKVITLDKPDLIIDKRINSGKRYGYVIRHSDFTYSTGEVLSFVTSGPLVVLTNSQRPEGIFAHDERYVYILDDYGQLHRYETASPKNVRIENKELITVEGSYRGRDGAFSPKDVKGYKATAWEYY
ncbi:hypothetical protein [Leminorella grimontii]|uniref:hypothetical protein n=1 Tax=Leminorella grimontii TaxID=82981 RepID=UPI00322047D5